MPAKPRTKPPPQTTRDYLATLEHAIRQLSYSQHLFTTFRHFVELSAIAFSNVAGKRPSGRRDRGQETHTDIAVDRFAHVSVGGEMPDVRNALSLRDSDNG